MRRPARQRGAYTVEFAIVAGVFFLLLFATFEIARFFWVYNTLNEMTRRGVFRTPAVFIDGARVLEGRQLREKDLDKWIERAKPFN